MVGFSILDAAALGFFATAWTVYHVFIERDHGLGLNHLMNGYRLRWMLEMADREQRMVDSGIMATLQNGTAFFASTSLLAIGGAISLLRASDDVQRVFSDLPLGLVASRGLWELKVIGILLIFGYAFFKFSWSYRLFNYAAILIGATPSKSAPDASQRRRMAMRAAEMNISAGKHFSRGQRAFFFALAYLGWFLGPYLFVATTAAVLVVMWMRQYKSDARAAATLEVDDLPPP
jgi:uncharacterized membrane protein